MATYNLGRKFEVARRQSGGAGTTPKYVVTDTRGAQVGGPYPSFADAARWRDACQRDADRKAKRGPRPCMCCARTFVSEGIHHRLCHYCRYRTDALGDSCSVGERISGKAGRSAARGGR